MKVVIIGGGAAGMMAAISASKHCNDVIILEKNNKLGKKLAITGKGRCNITFNGDEKKFFDNILVNNKFMYSSYNQFNNQDVVNFFESNGLKTKTERGGRIFPITDNSSDVISTLKKILEKNNVRILYNSEAIKINTFEGDVKSILLKSGNEIIADKIIIATGGCSYKVTGSTGDGYKLASELGHNITELKPGLIPLSSNDKICKLLQGLSLKNVKLEICDIVENKIIYCEQGEMMFAHFGITGPIVLSASSKLNRYKNINMKLKENKIIAKIDLKPALSKEQLNNRIKRDFDKYINKEFKNSLDDLLPKKLIPIVIEKCKINENKKVNQITKEEREKIVDVLKELSIVISGFLSIDIAIITAGGISTKEINPKTMESKLIKGLYFAGEIIDIDALTGGFNLQIAFSTGYTAGNSN